VLLSNGTGTGQLKLASGYVAMTWADVAAPTTTVDLSGTTIKTTQKVDVDTIKTNPVVNGGTITFPTNATVASTTNITAGTVTTATNVTTVNGIAANAITATAIAADAITAAKVAADVTTEITSGLALASATTDIQSRLPAALTAGGNMKSDVLAISGDTTAADTLEALMDGVLLVQVNGVATTTAIPIDGFTSVRNDQFKGRLLTLINEGTPTYEQTAITAYNHATQTLTVTALTAAPADNVFMVIH
jgi:hypothetical protein